MARRPGGRRGAGGPQVLVALLLGLSFGAAGCGTLTDGSRWGERAFSSFDSNTIARAARGAFFNPNTLVPLAGAAIFAIDDFDHRASDWAVRHNLVFGSEENAKDASDDLKTFLAVEALATALATPSGDDSGPWVVSKVKGIAVEAAAVGATQGVTALLKDATDRQRPDEHSDDSFPSAHSSSSFAYATLANRNLRYIDLPAGLRSTLQVGNVVLATGVAWARVEGRKHYPSDVLFGAALGYFLAAFVHDAFLNLPEDDHIDLATFSVEGGAGLQLSMRF